jgi:deoxyribonuclease V
MLHDLESLRAIQRQYASRVVERRLEADPELVAAVDMHLSESLGIGVVVTMRMPDLEVVEAKWVSREVDFPYIPGFLSFREAPLCIEAIGQLECRPDLLLVDGHGKAHPLRCGVASHIGVELALPTIGVAKSRLVGRHREPQPEKGSMTDLVSGDELIGRVLRTRDRVRPVFVSVGNLVTLDEAVRWTLELARRYRLPEPSHLAHKVASERARAMRSSGHSEK